MPKRTKKQKLLYKRQYNKFVSTETSPEGAILRLVTLMNSVTMNKETQVNALSISDNNGGRILL